MLKQILARHSEALLQECAFIDRLARIASGEPVADDKIGLEE